MRSWLLAEDPYGMNQRQEPTFGTPRIDAQRTPPQPGAKRRANSGSRERDSPRPARSGGGTAKPCERQLFGGQGARYSEAERDPRAQAWGEQAVDRSTAPSPTAEVDRTRGQAWGEQAVDKALNPPMGSGGGFWMPGEAADTASAVGEQAVARIAGEERRGARWRAGGLKTRKTRTTVNPSE